MTKDRRSLRCLSLQLVEDERLVFEGAETAPSTLDEQWPDPEAWVMPSSFTGALAWVDAPSSAAWSEPRIDLTESSDLLGFEASATSVVGAASSSTSDARPRRVQTRDHGLARARRLHRILARVRD